MNKIFWITFVVICTLAIVAPFTQILSAEERSFYDGMMAQCLYIPYVYVDKAPAYQTNETCRVLVGDARSKDLYHNRRELDGPGPTSEVSG